MALLKTGIVMGKLTPHYDVAGVLDGLVADVSFQVADTDGDLDGGRTFTKSVDIWPLITAQQQQSLTNIINAIKLMAVARA